MKLKTIQIVNYRSIEDVILDVNEVSGSCTFSLIGENEAGKSNILNAIALFDDDEKILTLAEDFNDKKKEISVTFTYTWEDSDALFFETELKRIGLPIDTFKKNNIQSFSVRSFWSKETAFKRNYTESISVTNTDLQGYKFEAGKIVATEDSESFMSFSSIFSLFEKGYLWRKTHKVHFWKADPKYLIQDNINLDTLIAAADISKISAPLANCLKLIGIRYGTELADLKTSSSERNNISEKLSDATTEHLKRVWPIHPIKVKFTIDPANINFFIEDLDVKHNVKTTSQRSDGLRQFLSFILTVSAEIHNESFAHSLLLLDEPEIHLHPQGQVYFMNELIRIGSTMNNIIFYATHSNYMIDRTELGRSIKVSKIGNSKTNTSPFLGKKTSYARVNYEVFNILTSDFHNELYGSLQAREDIDSIKDFDIFLQQKTTERKTWVKENKDKTKSPLVVTPSTYIRHKIHHPENGSNNDYTELDLKNSIEFLLKLF